MTKPLRIDMIDLSDFQETLNILWPEAKKGGVKGVYQKATEGTNWKASDYERRRAQADRNGLKFGAYHFAHPAPGNAQAEAKWFVEHAKIAAGDLMPVLDLERNDHKMSEDALAQWVGTWFRTVWSEAGLTGASKKGFLYTQMNVTSVPKGVLLWAPRYNNDNRPPSVPTPFKTWAMWQFTDGQFGVPSTVPGVGRVDASHIHRHFGFARLGKFLLPTPKVAKHHHKKPAVKMTPIDKIVALAKSQIGYHEGRSNGNWNNIQKFSKQVPTLTWSDGQPWCCTFVSWLALKSGLAAFYPCTASCATAEAWWKQNGHWSEYPAIGAQVIYGNGEHTGLVVNYDDTWLYAVEGNTNTNGSAEGDGVYLKKRLRRDPYVSGYGYPQIPGVRLKSADPNYKG